MCVCVCVVSCCWVLRGDLCALLAAGSGDWGRVSAQGARVVLLGLCPWVGSGLFGPEDICMLLSASLRWSLAEKLSSLGGNIRTNHKVGQERDTDPVPPLSASRFWTVDSWRVGAGGRLFFFFKSQGFHKWSWVYLFSISLCNSVLSSQVSSGVHNSFICCWYKKMSRSTVSITGFVRCAKVDNFEFYFSGQC